MIKEKNKYFPPMGSVPTSEEWDEMARDYEHEAVARAGYKIKSFIVPHECDISTKYYRTKFEGEESKESDVHILRRGRYGKNRD